MIPNGRTVAALAVLLLAGCGGSSSPTGTAAGLLSKTGATSNGPAYTVTSSDTEATCSNGAAEADGTLAQQYDVSVCVFPSNDQLQSDMSAGQYAAGSAVIQVGQTTLIFIAPGTQASYTNQPPPASVVQPVISETGGQNVTPAL